MPSLVAHGSVCMLSFAMLAFTLTGCAATLQDQAMLPLYQGPAPAAQGPTDADIPAMEVCLPSKDVRPTGAAMIVLPGGGYAHLSPHEGRPVGQWLASNGITAFVVRYRIGPKYHHPVELHDAQRALRYVRAHAKTWGLDPQRIGILGFSAGGHLASSVATHFDDGNPQASDRLERVSSRPNVQVLIYPVITMATGTHRGSRENLLGANPDPALVELMSNEKQVTPQTPPAFLFHSTADRTVPIASNTDRYAEALKEHQVPYEYVRGELGNHGIALDERWTTACLAWLRKQGF